MSLNDALLCSGKAGNCDFPSEKITGVQSFDFVPIFPISDDNNYFSTRNRFFLQFSDS